MKRALALTLLLACGEAPAGPPFPVAPDSWTLGVLPDTQTYAEMDPESFLAQTSWLAGERDRLRLAAVVHLGDIVEHNQSAAEWLVAQDAFALFDDAALPYVLASGNHDIGSVGVADDRSTRLNEFFSFDAIAAWPEFGGAFEPGHLENAFYRLDPAGTQWLVLSLEFAPRDPVLAWAEGVLAAHPTRRVILVTHAYLYSDGTRYRAEAAAEQAWDPSEYGVFSQPGGAAYGETIFERLVEPFGQVELVLCGHVLNEGVARLTSAQADGGFVHEVLANFQERDLPDIPLRVIEVDDAAGLFRVRTVSPRTGAWLLDEANSFDLPMDR